MRARAELGTNVVTATLRGFVWSAVGRFIAVLAARTYMEEFCTICSPSFDRV